MLSSEPVALVNSQFCISRRQGQDGQLSDLDVAWNHLDASPSVSAPSAAAALALAEVLRISVTGTTRDLGRTEATGPAARNEFVGETKNGWRKSTSAGL